MSDKLNNSLRKLNFLSKNTQKHGFENILKCPSLIEETKISDAMHIAEEIYSLINFKNLREDYVIRSNNSQNDN